MEIRVEQEYFNLTKYTYKIFDSTDLVLTAKANRTIVPWLRTITINNFEGKQLYKLKQQNVLWLLLEHTPIVSYLVKSSCPYIFYEGDKKKGQFQELYYFNGGTVKANIGDKEYCLYALTGNYVSIFLGNEQVGLISREEWKHGDSDKYKVLFNSNIKMPLATVFTILSDILWFTSDTHFSSVSWEYNIQLGNPKGDRDWQPEEKTSE